MFRWYGLDVDDVGTPRLSWRRFRNLVSKLPRESALAVEVGGDAVAWGATEHLLAAAVDVLQILAWQRTDTKKNPRPKPLARPGEKPRPSDMHARLLAQRKRLRR